MSVKTRYFLFLSLLVVLVFAPVGQSAESNQAAIVVAFGDGRVDSRCVDFSESEISGLDLLDRSGLSYEVEANGGFGAAICKIDDTGCPAGNCFCECSGGSDCVYWSYWLKPEGSWVYSLIGASSSVVTHGSIEGWSWGPGNPGSAIAPPDLTFGDVCAPQATNTPVPTETAIPTDTPAPTNTPVPTLTATPSATLVPSINFTVDGTSIPAGSCTTLRWDVTNVTAVYLDEVGVSGQGEQEICPAGTQTYSLRVVYGESEEIQQLTVEVTEATATAMLVMDTATAVPAGTTVQPTTIPSPTNLPTIQSATPIPTVMPSATDIVEVAEAMAETAIVVVIVAPALPTDLPATQPPGALEAPGGLATELPTTQPPGALEAPGGVESLPYFVFVIIVLGLSVILLLVRWQT